MLSSRRTLVLRLTLAAALVALSAFFVFKRPPPDTGGDQPRYATLGLNLAEHGVFSAETYASNAKPAPSLAWAGPLVATELALAALIDRGTKETLVCLAAGSSL